MSKMKIAGIFAVILVALLALNYYLDNNTNTNTNTNMNTQQQEEQLKQMALNVEEMKPFWHGVSDPQVNFSNVSVGETEALIEYAYPAEGVSAKVTFKKIGDEWQVSGSEVQER